MISHFKFRPDKNSVVVQVLEPIEKISGNQLYLRPRLRTERESYGPDASEVIEGDERDRREPRLLAERRRRRRMAWNASSKISAKQEVKTRRFKLIKETTWHP